MQPCPCYRAVLERCSSGLRGTPGKRVYSKRVSGVRISFSPQTEKENQRQVHLNADFLFRFAPPRRRRQEMSERQRRNLGEKEARRTAYGRCRSASGRNPGEKEVRRTAYGKYRSASERNLREKEVRGPAYGRCRSDSERNPREKEVRQASLRTRPVISDDDLLNQRRLRVIRARYQESFRTTCMPQFSIYC